MNYQIYTIYFILIVLLAQKWLDTTHRGGVLDLPSTGWSFLAVALFTGAGIPSQSFPVDCLGSCSQFCIQVH